MLITGICHESKKPFYRKGRQGREGMQMKTMAFIIAEKIATHVDVSAFGQEVPTLF